jgi:hypothetical protein
MSTTYQKRVPNILRKKITTSTEPSGKIISSIKIIQEKEIKNSEHLVFCEKERKPIVTKNKEIPPEKHSSKKKKTVEKEPVPEKKVVYEKEPAEEPSKQDSKKKNNVQEDEPSKPDKVMQKYLDLFLAKHEQVSTTLKEKELEQEKITELLDYLHNTMVYTDDAKKAMSIFSVLYKQAIIFRRSILYSIVKMMADIFFQHISHTYPNAFPEFLYVIIHEKNTYSTYLYYITLFTTAKKTPFIELVDSIFLSKTGRNIAVDSFEFDLYHKPKTENELYDLFTEETNSGKINAISLLYYMKKNDKKLIEHFYKHSVSSYDSGMLLKNMVDHSDFFTDAKTFRFFAIYLSLVVVYGIYVEFSTRELYEKARDSFDDSLINTFPPVGTILKRKSIQKEEIKEEDFEMFNKLL